MTNEEMKVLKFKTMVDGLYEKIEETPIFFNKGKGPFVSGVEVLLGNGDENPCLKTILREPTCGVVRAASSVYGNLFGTGKSHSCSSSRCGLAPSIKNLILASKDCLKCEYACESCSMPFQTMFFALIALAIDEKLYTEKLEMVSDTAYMMGFNEAMIEDWTTVVKKFLMSEEIDSQQLKTEEAKKFFAFFKNN